MLQRQAATIHYITGMMRQNLQITTHQEQPQQADLIKVENRNSKPSKKEKREFTLKRFAHRHRNA